jgi:hypothetical protein
MCFDGHEVLPCDVRRCAACCGVGVVWRFIKNRACVCACAGDTSAPTDVFPRHCRVSVGYAVSVVVSNADAFWQPSCLSDEIEVKCDTESVALRAAAACPKFLATTAVVNTKQQQQQQQAIAVVQQPAVIKVDSVSSSNSDQAGNSNGNNNNGAGSTVATQMKDDGPVYTAVWFIVVIYVIIPILVILCVVWFILGCVKDILCCPFAHRV